MPDEGPGFSSKVAMDSLEPTLEDLHSPMKKLSRFFSFRFSPSKVLATDPHAYAAWREVERSDRFKTKWMQEKLTEYEKNIAKLKEDPKGFERAINEVSKFALEVEGGTPQYQEMLKRLSPAQRDYYQFVRKDLDELADWLHIPKEERITNYVGHYFDKHTLIKAWQDELVKAEGMPLASITMPRTIDGQRIYEKLQAIENLPYGRRGLDSIPKELLNNFLLERKTGLISEDFSIDRMYRMYIMRAARTGFDNPALLRVQQALPLIKDPHTLQYAREFFHDYFSGAKVGGAEDLSRIWMSLMFNLKIGGNLRSPLSNLSQTLFTNAEIGLQNTVSGGSMLWKSKGARELFEASGHTATIPQFYRYDLSNASRGISKIDDALDTLGKKTGVLFNAAEYVNRGVAFLGGIQKGLIKAGYTPTEAMSLIDQKLAPLSGTPLMQKVLDYADDVVIKTQFRYGRADLPAFLRKNPVARALFQFQTFGIKSTEFIADMAREPEGLQKLMSFLAIQYGATQAGKHLLGTDLREVFGVGIDPIEGLQALRKMQSGDFDKPSITETISKAFPLVNGKSGILPWASGNKFIGPGGEFVIDAQETLRKVGVAFDKGKPFSEVGQIVLDGMKGTVSHAQSKRLLKAYREYEAEKEEGKIDAGKIVSVILGFPNYKWLGQQEYLKLHRKGKSQEAESFRSTYEREAKEPLKVPRSLTDEAIEYAAGEKQWKEKPERGMPGLSPQLEYLMGGEQ